MGMNVVNTLKSVGTFTGSAENQLRDPMAALMLLFGAAQNGQGVDPRALRSLLAQLDPALLENLIKSVMPEVMHPGAKAFMQDNRGPSPWGPSKTSGSGPTGTSSPWSPASMDACFPKLDCFPGCKPKPTWDCVPERCPDEPSDCGPKEPGCEPTPGTPEGAAGKTFDVWFEHKDGQKTKQRSPIVLDLNGNGRPDLTGDVKVENNRWVAKGGGKVDFDIDPTKRSWKTKSIQRRPGAGAPAVPGGTAKIFDKDGKLVSEGVPLKEALKKGKNGIKEGRVEVYDANNQLVGELKQDEKSGKMMYHFGGRKDAEKSEWMAANGGDALLAWDVDGNGKIDSSKELFGEFDNDGTKKFANGYEKLAAYFDENKDGMVDANELKAAEAKGVRVWRDTNGDAKTDAGELGSVLEAGITSLGTKFDAADMSSTFTQNRV